MEQSTTNNPPTNNAGNNDNTMALLGHIFYFVCAPLSTIILWLVLKNKSDYLKGHLKEALNFQITIFIITIILMVLSAVITYAVHALIFVFTFLYIVVGVGAMILAIIAAIKAGKGETYRYPFNIRLIK